MAVTDTTPAGLQRAIGDGAAGMQLPVDAQNAERLAFLLTELERWNRRINLTAIRDLREMVAAHVLDSLVARPLLHGSRILDVGTGGGFPGLPLAIVAPELDFTLLDGNGKKISFVQHMIGELGLDNARAVKSRVEAYQGGEGFDTVITRAFAALPKMLDLTGHLVSETGVLLALKGKYPAAELAELGSLNDSWDIQVTELTVPGLAEHARHAVRLARKRQSA